MPSLLMMPMNSINQISRYLIPVKASITCLKKGNVLLLCGPLGHLFFSVPLYVQVIKKDRYIHVLCLEADKTAVTAYIRILQQKLKGLDLGWFEVLMIQGIGWRVTQEANRSLCFSLGHSHSVVYKPKLGIEVTLYDKQHFKVFGLDLVLVQQTVADLCCIRRYSVYKGKGIRKLLTQINLKVSSKSKA